MPPSEGVWSPCMGGGLLVGGPPSQGGASFLGECLLPEGVLLGGASFPGDASFLRGVPPSGGFGLLVGVGVSLWGASLPGGCLLPGGVPPSRGGLVSLPGGCLFPRGSPCQGASLQGDSPPVDRITDRSKTITLATTSLRPVITEFNLPAMSSSLTVSLVS